MPKLILIIVVIWFLSVLKKMLKAALKDLKETKTDTEDLSIDEFKDKDIQDADYEELK